VANESGEPDLRSVWQAQPEMERRMSTDDIRGRVRSIARESSRRSAVMVVCGAVIVPSWMAVAWSLQDFRLLATVCIATALWILYHAHRNTVARHLTVDVTSTPSLAFYRELLKRELDWHRRLPRWLLPPAVLSTAAIALTFYTSARFAHTPVFFAMMAWIVGGSAVAVVIGLKRSQREATRCQRELDTLES
jgi:uncharacterized membrane protein YjjP (DUF1212 family)